MKPPIIKISLGSLDGNYHGPKGKTLRLTWLLVRMQAHVHVWTLYLYGRSGATRHITVAFPRWKGEWPE